MNNLPVVRSPWRIVILLLGFTFLYAPMLMLVIYSFNSSKLVTVWAGWSTRWYGELLRDDAMMSAVGLSLTIAACAATAAAILGTIAAVVLVRFGRFRGSNGFAFMITAPLVMPDVITGLSLLLLFVALAHAIGVVLVQFVIFDNGNQAVGIRRVGGITGFLQASRPPFIVSDFQFEERSIPGTSCQELGMVLVGLLGMFVGAETLPSCIVVMADGLSPPITTALDTEVVVRFTGKGTFPGTGLQQALCQSDAGRNVILLHFLYCQVTVFLDIIFVLFVAGLCLHRQAAHHQQKGAYQFFHGLSFNLPQTYNFI